MESPVPEQKPAALELWLRHCNVYSLINSRCMETEDVTTSIRK